MASQVLPFPALHPSSGLQILAMRVFSSPTPDKRRASECISRSDSASFFGTSVLEQHRASDSAIREDSRNSTERVASRSNNVGVFLTDKENRSPVAPVVNKEGSALWVKLREVEAELEKERSAAKPLHEASAKLEKQEEQIKDLEQQNRVYSESLERARSEYEELLKKHASIDHEHDLRFCRFREKVIESLDHMSEDVAKLSDQADTYIRLRSNKGGKCSSASLHGIFSRLRSFQDKTLQSLDYMNEEVAKMHEQTDAKIRYDSMMHARLAATRLVHKCVVRHLVSDDTAPIIDTADSRKEPDEGIAEGGTIAEERASWQKQNRELALTVEMLIQEKQQLEAENKHISNVAAIFEKKYEDIAGQNARLMGHINHKQKIQHTLQLKEEISELRASLALAQKRCFQLESGLTHKQLDHLLASTHNEDDGARVAGTSRRSMTAHPHSICDWNSERMKIDLQHLISLIRGVVLDCRAEEPTSDLTGVFEKLRLVMQARVQRRK
jgi:chromosome segregation ATPase